MNREPSHPSNYLTQSQSPSSSSSSLHQSATTTITTAGNNNNSNKWRCYCYCNCTTTTPRTRPEATAISRIRPAWLGLAALLLASLCAPSPASINLKLVTCSSYESLVLPSASVEAQTSLKQTTPHNEADSSIRQDDRTTLRLDKDATNFKQGTLRNETRPVFKYHLSHSRPPSMVQMNIQSLVDKGQSGSSSDNNSNSKDQNAYYVKAYQLLRELAYDTKRHHMIRTKNLFQRRAISGTQESANGIVHNASKPAINSNSSTTTTTTPMIGNQTIMANSLEDSPNISSSHGHQMQLQVPLQLHLKLKPLPLPLPPPAEVASKRRRSLAPASGHWEASGSTGSKLALLGGADQRLKDGGYGESDGPKVAMSMFRVLNTRPRPPSNTIPFTPDDAKETLTSKLMMLDGKGDPGKEIKLGGGGPRVLLFGAGNKHHQHHQYHLGQQRGPQSPTTPTTPTSIVAATTATSNGRRPLAPSPSSSPSDFGLSSGIDESLGATPLKPIRGDVLAFVGRDSAKLPLTMTNKNEPLVNQRRNHLFMQQEAANKQPAGAEKEANVSQQWKIRQEEQTSRGAIPLESFREVVVSPMASTTTTTKTTTASTTTDHASNGNGIQTLMANNGNGIIMASSRLDNQQSALGGKQAKVHLPLSEFWLALNQHYQNGAPTGTTNDKILQFWPIEASAHSSAASVSFLHNFYNQVLRKAPTDSVAGSSLLSSGLNGYPMTVRDYDMMTTTANGSRRHIVSALADSKEDSGDRQRPVVAPPATGSDNNRGDQKVASASAPRTVVYSDDTPSTMSSSDNTPESSMSIASTTTTTTTRAPSPVVVYRGGANRRPALKMLRKNKKAAQNRARDPPPPTTTSASPEYDSGANDEPATTSWAPLVYRQETSTAPYPVSMGLTNAPTTSVKRVTTLHNDTNMLITVTSSSSVVSSSSSSSSLLSTTVRPDTAILMASDLAKRHQETPSNSPTTASPIDQMTTLASQQLSSQDEAPGHRGGSASGYSYPPELARQVPQPPTPTVASTGAALVMASEVNHRGEHTSPSPPPTSTIETTSTTIIDVDIEDGGEPTTLATTATSTHTISTTAKPQHSGGARMKMRRYQQQHKQQETTGRPAKNGPRVGQTSQNGLQKQDQPAQQSPRQAAAGNQIKLFHFKRKPDLKKFPFYNSAALFANATVNDNSPVAKESIDADSDDDQPSGEREQVPALKERTSSDVVQIKPIAAKMAGSPYARNQPNRPTTAATATAAAAAPNSTSANGNPKIGGRATSGEPSDSDDEDEIDDQPSTTTAATTTATATTAAVGKQPVPAVGAGGESNKPIIRLRRKHGDNFPLEQQFAGQALGLVNAMGQPRQFFKNRHKQHQPPLAMDARHPNPSAGISLFPSQITRRQFAPPLVFRSSGATDMVANRKTRARSLVGVAGKADNPEDTNNTNTNRRSDRDPAPATGSSTRKPLTNMSAINAHGSNTIVLVSHPKKDRKRLESLIQSSNYYRVLISMMKPQQQRELMDLMISKNKSLADAAATYMQSEKNIQLLAAMQLHNQTVMQQQRQKLSDNSYQSGDEAALEGPTGDKSSPMEEEASQRKASYAEAGEPAQATRRPKMDTEARPSQMFTSLVGDGAPRPSSPKLDGLARYQQEASKQPMGSVGHKKMRKLLEKPMRPAKYSLNGYIPKPSLSLLSKDLDSSSSTNEVLSRRKGGLNQNHGHHHQHQQLGQNGRPPMASSSSARSGSSPSAGADHLASNSNAPRSFVLSPHKANLIKARLGLLSSDASERRVTVSSDSDNNSNNNQTSQDGPDKSAALSTIPKTDFECTDKQGKFISGVFADHKAGCQVWHLCSNNRKYSFLCPSGTIFNAKLRICDWQYNVKCQDTRN